jgi:hypothetical protein
VATVADTTMKKATIWKKICVKYGNRTMVVLTVKVCMVVFV